VSRLLASPLEHYLSTDRTGTILGFDERDELGQDDFIGTYLEAEGFTQTQVGRQLGV
jgi:hypothetical protein